MSAPPPGYNPGDSLLHGGTSVPIHAVQGGGGAITTDPTQSLLSGGETAVIHGVQGGGDREAENFNLNNNNDSTISTINSEFAREAEEALAAVEAEERGMVVPAEAINSKYKTIRYREVQLPNTAALLPIDPDSRKTRLDYVNYRLSMWKRYQRSETGSSNARNRSLKSRATGLVSDVLGTRSSGSGQLGSPALRAAPEQVRLFTQGSCGGNILNSSYPATDNKEEGGFDRLAVVLPETTETITVFPAVEGREDVLAKCIEIWNEGANLKDNVYLFSAPFYGSDPEVNKKLNKAIMYITVKSQAQVYVMNQHTLHSQRVGCALPDELPDTTSPVVNFLEPTYVVYPFKRSFDGSDIRGLLFAATPGGVKVPTTSQPSRLAGLGGFVRAGMKGPMAFPANMKTNDTFFGEGGNSDAKFRLVSLHSTVPVDTSIADVYTLKEGARPMTRPITATSRFEPTGAEYLSLDAVGYVPVYLGSGLYTLRQGVPSVVQDWRDLRFLPDEAKFLNDMNLRPKMLEDIFKGRVDVAASAEAGAGGLSVSALDWKKELANFLRSLTVSKCFEDTRLLSHHDCSLARKFVERVFKYFLEHDERIAELTEEEKEAMQAQLQLRARSAQEEATAAEDYAKNTLQRTRDIVNSIKTELQGTRQLAAIPAGQGAAAAAVARQRNPFLDGFAKMVGRIGSAPTALVGAVQGMMPQRAATPGAATPGAGVGGVAQALGSVVPGMGSLASAVASPSAGPGLVASIRHAAGEIQGIPLGRGAFRGGGADIESIPDVIHDMQNPNMFYHHFIAINDASGEIIRGILEVLAPTPLEGERLLIEKREAMRDTYPGWRFL